MSLTTLRCYWLVAAGVVPGIPEESLTKRWEISNTEWEETEVGDRLPLIAGYAAEAFAYAMVLSARPENINWVRADYVWA